MWRKALQRVPDHESFLELWVRLCLEALGNEIPSWCSLGFRNSYSLAVQSVMWVCSIPKTDSQLQVSCNHFLGDSDLLSLTTVKLRYKKLSLGQIYMAMFFFQKFNKTKPLSPRISPLYCLVLPPIPQFCQKQTLRGLFFLNQNRADPLFEFSLFCVSAIEKNKLFSQYKAEMTLLGCPSCLWWISFWGILTQVQTSCFALPLLFFNPSI